MVAGETLGVAAHRGGMLVETPVLSVGLVQAVARPTGLELELLARRPLDRRGAAERQADIRAGRTGPPPAPRVLLPPYDEGLDLRVGRLDEAGRAHWAFSTWSSSSSGDTAEGTAGPVLRLGVGLPALFDHVAVVLAWPEIGFPETVVDLPLPDRATVERGTVSVWDAPPLPGRAPGALRRTGDRLVSDALAVEAGRLVAGPQVLARAADAVVVLTRLTAVGADLSFELLSLARDDAGGAAAAEDTAATGLRGPGASVAVVRDGDAIGLRPHEATSSGGPRAFRSTAEYAVQRPATGALDVLLAWPAAGLAEVQVTIALTTP